MKILVVEPGKQPQIQEIESKLTAMQMTVGGYIEAIYPWWEKVALVCNEAGKMIGLPLNRPVFDDRGVLVDIIAGTFFLCGALLDSGTFTDLPEDLVEHYTRIFQL